MSRTVLAMNAGIAVKGPPRPDATSSPAPTTSPSSNRGNAKAAPAAIPTIGIDLRTDLPMPFSMIGPANFSIAFVAEPPSFAAA